MLLVIGPLSLHGQQPKFRTTAPPPVLDETPSYRYGTGFNAPNQLTALPDGSFQPDRAGISQATLFRNTQFPTSGYLAPDPVGPTVRTDSASASFKVSVPSVGGNVVPFLQQGFEPQDADLKIGPLFFKVRDLEAAVLHSDNVNLTRDNRESGTIAYVGLTIDMLAQVTENLHFATSVTLVYLPLENRFGLAGYGMTDLYNFGFTGGPLAHAQVTWDTDIGGWHVVFMDDFEVSPGYYSEDLRSNDVLFQGSLFNEDLQTRTGRYALGPAAGPAFRTGEGNQIDNQFNTRSDVIVYSNTISADAERLDPGTVLLHARAYHQDLWYNQGNRGLPSLRDGLTISLISERENMRFKPYFIYDLYHTDDGGNDTLQHIFRVGFSGPITDQLFLSAELGYYMGGEAGDTGGDGMLWNVSLDHTAGPYTHESLTYARSFNFFHNEINEGVGYNLSQILGPHLQGQLYAYRVRSEEFFDNATFSTNQWLAGARVTWQVGPKTTVVATGEYTNFDDGGQGLLGRVDVGYNFTDTLLLQFYYQHTENNSPIFGQNYRENLFYLSLTKYFE